MLRETKGLVHERLMRGWEFSDEMRMAVHNQTKKKLIPSTYFGNRRLAWLVWGSLACFLVLILLNVPSNRLLPPGRTQVQTLSEARVDLDGFPPDEVVKILQVAAADLQSSSQVAAIWAQSPQHQQWQLVYSEPLKGGGPPMPIQTVPLPDNSRLLMVSTQEGNGDFLHYRVLGYDGRQVRTYLSRDFIPGGQLDSGPGYVSEKSWQEESFFRWNGSALINEAFSQNRKPLIVTYHLGVDGKPVFNRQGPVQLKLGDYLLVEPESGPNAGRVLLAGGALNRDGRGFKAVRKGSAQLIVLPAETAWEGAAELNIKVD